MKRLCTYLATLLLSVLVRGQAGSVLVIEGQVTSNGHPVPYATLQVKGTSIGVSCNDAGCYELRLPASCEADSVLVRSVGYIQAKVSVRRLLRSGQIFLRSQAVELKEVQVTSYRDGRQLINAVVERIARNCHQRTSHSTFFFRDWRTLNGELYLFDEAVMRVQRAPYSAYADKRGYQLDPNQREMESNYKFLLRHRLLVADRRMLQRNIRKPLGVYQRLEYSDNTDFFDPLSTPQATYTFAKRFLRQHTFQPIQQFTADSTQYYLVRSEGPNRYKKRARYEYVIRCSDLALVRLASVQIPFSQHAPQDAWVNHYFNGFHLDADSSVWTYDLRDSAYTLTRYFNLKTYRLTSRGRGHDLEQQRWQQCRDWHLTDFTLAPPPPAGDPIEVRPQTLTDAFGQSNYSSDFWGRYNSIPIDTLPLRLLQQKLKTP